MKPLVKSLHLNNLIYKIIAVIFGYSFWLILAQHQNISISIDMPICFFELNENFEIQSPEKIKVTLNAKRSDFYNLNVFNESIHINLNHIKQTGEYNIQLLPEHILLHNKIKLLNYFPSSLNIKVTESKKI